jgi:thioredoxin reductase
MTTLPEATPARDPDSAVDADALVVGGGAAGLSAAVFLARYGLVTLVCDGGASAIRQCARIENYLGIPAIAPDRFLELGRTHAEREGATVREERVTAIARPDDGGEADGDATADTESDTLAVGADAHGPDWAPFRVETTDGAYVASRVLVATAYDGAPLAPLADELGEEPPASHEAAEAMENPFLPTDEGRTAVDGLYAAGWMTGGTVHQVQTNAGDGARAALALCRDDMAARYWPAVAERYVDWVVDEHRYGGEEWAEGVEEWFERDLLPAPEGVDAETVEHAREDLKAEFLGRRLTGAPEPVDREGQLAMLAHLDDAVVREYAADLDDD